MMEDWKKQLASSPGAVRVIPFIAFLILTSSQGALGEGSVYWMYLIKTLVGIGLIRLMWPYVTEMRWCFSGSAIAVGVGVFALWIGLDGWYPTWGKGDGTPWNPFVHFEGNHAIAWAFVAVRILGSTFVVPPLEEVFYRSTVYRYIVSSDFLGVRLGQRHLGAWIGTSLIFGLAHHEWLAGILCGLAYQWLVLRRGRLGEAMTAHAITNALLGVYVVTRGAWQFW